jgi:SPW repeat
MLRAPPATGTFRALTRLRNSGGVTVRALSWINFVLGLWLIVAGFVLSRGSAPVMTEEVVLGIIIAVLAFWSAIGTEATALSWAIAVAGLWTLIAPSVIHYTILTASKTNDIVVGIIVLVLGFANAVYRQSPARTHA